MTSLADLYQRNRAGDLEAIPVQPEDTSSWWDRVKAAWASGGWQDPQPGQRGTFVPSRINEQGKAEAAVPGIIHQPAEGLYGLMTAPLSDIVRSGDRDAIRAASEASFDVASMLPAAGVAAGRTMPTNAAGMGGGKLDPPLPMDKASRMARAKEMGFDTDQVLYHGTGKTFDEFNPGTRGNGTARSIYLTDNPDIADIYANSKNYGLKGGGDPMIYPVLAKSKKPLVVSDKGPDGSFGWVSDNLAAALGVEHPPAGKYATLYDEARRQGYDQVQIREMTDLGGPQTQYIPLKPEYIRSVNAAFDPAKKNSANLLASNPDDPTTAAILAAMQAQDKPKGITAYHGSPHDFDRFDMSKIGTGEGAQAYGHGLYFAENEGVARSYRDALGNYDDTVKWKGDQPPTPLQQQLIDRLSGNDATTGQMMTTHKLRNELVRARRYVSDIDDNGNMVPGKGPNARRYQELTDLLDELKRSEQFIEVTPPGRMYEVRINADPNDFLDWDKPLSQQSEKVRALLEHPAVKRQTDFFGDPAGEKLTGKSAYGAVANWNTAGNQRAGSGDPTPLRDAGIPGIRYLDQGSRVAGEGSRNYVVFDDALVEILRKYSNAPDPTTAAILALLTQQQGAQPQQ